MYLYSNPNFGHVSYHAKHGVCTLYIQNISGMGPNDEWIVPVVIPVEFRPKNSIYVPLTYGRKNSVGAAWIPSNNHSDDHIYIYSTDAADGNIALSGIISWCY